MPPFLDILSPTFDLEKYIDTAEKGMHPNDQPDWPDAYTLIPAQPPMDAEEAITGDHSPVLSSRAVHMRFYGSITVDGAATHALLSRVECLQRRGWDSLDSNKALCWLANPYAYDTHDAYARIVKSIAAILPEASRFRITAPVPDPFFHNATPVAFLIWNLSYDEHTLIVHHGLWALAAPVSETLFTIAYDGLSSPFNHTIHGFVCPDSRFSAHEISNLARKAINSCGAAHDFVKQYHDAFLYPEVTSPSVELLTDSIAVDPFQYTDMRPSGPRVSRTYWNVFVRSPTNIPGPHRTWRKLLADIPLTSLSMGSSAPVAEAFLCALCLGTSHPTDICPFPLYPGWNGPTAADIHHDITLPRTLGSPSIAFAGEAVTSDAEDSPDTDETLM